MSDHELALLQECALFQVVRIPLPVFTLKGSSRVFNLSYGVGSQRVGVEVLRRLHMLHRLVKTDADLQTLAGFSSMRTVLAKP